MYAVKHHRLPSSKGGSNKKTNLSLVEVEQHIAYHILFKTMTPQEIAELLTEVWIDPAYKMVAVLK